MTQASIVFARMDKSARVYGDISPRWRSRTNLSAHPQAICDQARLTAALHPNFCHAHDLTKKTRVAELSYSGAVLPVYLMSGRVQLPAGAYLVPSTRCACPLQNALFDADAWPNSLDRSLLQPSSRFL